MPLGANKAVLFGMGGVSTGEVILIETYTAAGEGEKVFSSLNNADYKSMIFEFIDLHGSVNDTDLTFQVRDADDDYGTINVTTSAVRVYRDQSGSSTGFAYNTAADSLAASGKIPLTAATHFDAQYALNGYMTLYNPASTTYATNFVSRLSIALQTGNYPSCEWYFGGYADISKALTAIRFDFAVPDANMDTGIIRQWGVK